jgi:hypothetical protein
VARRTPIAKEAPPFGHSVRMKRGERLWTQRREMLAHPPQVGLARPPLGQIEHPLAGALDTSCAGRAPSKRVAPRN